MNLGLKSPKVTDLDIQWMRYALRVGRRAAGQTWPNPPVGCVLVRDGTVVGVGHTCKGGRPHAERQALGMAGARARGATAYVTLEPCSHHGQTPPCAEALIKAQVKRVVVAAQDPDPRVNGGGLERLRRAGIDVQTGICTDEAKHDLRGFLTKITLGRPFVTLKLATSLDGRIATASGASQWITGPKARQDVHRLRLEHDAVMVGAGTARADDPQLNVRGMGTVDQPVRIVASRKLDIPFPSALSNSIHTSPLWLVHGAEVNESLRQPWQGSGAQLIEGAALNGRLDLQVALQKLGQKGLTTIFCEGGGTLAASLLSDDLVDQLILYQGPMTLGAEGWPSVGALGLETLDQAPKFALIAHSAMGTDVVSYWRRQRHNLEP